MPEISIDDTFVEFCLSPINNVPKFVIRSISVSVNENSPAVIFGPVTPCPTLGNPNLANQLGTSNAPLSTNALK